MLSLLWKEWHEQSWKLAFGSLILGAFALIGLHARVVADELLLQWVCFLAVALLPVLASTGLIPAERDDGTLESLLSLPIAPWRVFAVKSAMGVVLTAGPIFVAAIVSVVFAGGREMPGAAMAGLYVRTLAAALSLFFWMYALTVRLPTETRASLIAMAVLIMWLLIALGLTQTAEHTVWRPSVEITVPSPSPLWVICPFVFLIPPKNIGPTLMLGAVFIQASIAALLLFWASSRFARPTVSEGL